MIKAQNLICKSSSLYCSIVLVVLTVIFGLSATARAQSAAATLAGTVEDQNGAVVPGVGVTVQNVGTSFKRQVTTDENGSFTVALLPPGTYTVMTRRDGFTPVEIRGLVLNIGDQKALNIQLKAGDVNATVTVDGGAGTIRTDASVGTVIDRQFVSSLPLNGRSLQSLILLSPGVLLVTTTDALPGQFSINGQRNNANYFTVDGVSANIGVSTSTSTSLGYLFSQQMAGTAPGATSFGGTNNLVSIDALQEFKIQTSSYSAEYGRQPGGQVQLVTRSGENQFHGTAFDYLRNEVLDANDWFANSRKQKRAPLRQNQFGGTFSGPVLLPKLYAGRNRTFFFFSYEGQRLRLPSSANYFVPSLRLRQAAAPSVQPLLNAFPVPNGPETTVGGTPTGLSPFFAVYSSPSSMDATSLRVDHSINSKLTLFGRFSDTPSETLSRGLNLISGKTINTRTFTSGATLVATDHLTNEVRFNWSRNRGRSGTAMDDFGGAVPIELSQLISGYNGAGSKFGLVFISFPSSPGNGLSLSLGDSVDNYERQINIVDNVSWLKGGHQFKFGIDYRRLTPIFGPVEYQQTVIFTGEAQLTNPATAGLVTISASQGSRPIYNNVSTFAQDTWKVSRRLSIDLGVRWEVNPPPHDANGKEPLLVTGVDNLSTAKLAPAGTEFYQAYYGAFAPRLGIAYQLNQTSGRETVIRTGFGLYYDLGNGQSGAAFAGYPFNSSVSSFNTPYPLSSTIATPPAFPTATLPISAPLYALNPDLRLPYTMQWNLAVQQSIGKEQSLTLSYVASAARHLLRTVAINQRKGNPFTGPRPNPKFAIINLVTNGPTSNYQSLQAQYDKRLSRGLQALASYTWSHAIDQVSNEITPNSLDLGNADFDIRHKLTTAVTYDLPSLRRVPVLSTVSRGWSFYTTLTVQSGAPLNPRAGNVLLEDGTLAAVRPDVIEGVPFWIKDSTVPGGQRLNRAAFVLPPALPGAPGYFTRPGTLGRNVVRAAARYQIDIALQRRFKLWERTEIQFKAEAFNVLNHPLFAGQDTNLQSPAFGVPTTTLNKVLGGLGSLYQMGGSRSMQMSLRVSF